jgi:hypothetical protein
MASRFWVTGGTGDWNSTTNWSATTGGASGASVPSSSDTATFDASSGSGTITLDISPTIQTLTCTGFTGTLAFGTNTISLNSTGTIFTGATTMTVTGTPLIICTNSSATSRTITPTAVTEANSISFRITGGTGSLGFTSGGNVKDLDFTDGVNPTGFAGAINSVGMSVFGNFKASTGMTQTGGTGVMTFAATSGTKTINTAGVTFDRPFTFNGVGGTFQLASALTSGATRTCTLTNGTLDLASYTLTTGLFSSTNSNVRTLAFGTGKIVATGTNASVYNTSIATNLTITGTRTIEFTGVGTGGQIRSISGGVTTTGGTAATAVDLYIQAGADTIELGTANRTYRTLNFTGFSGATAADTRPNIYGDLVLSAAMTVTGGTNSWVFAATTAQTITTNSVTINNPINFNGIGGTWTMQDALTLGSTRTLTLTNGTLQLKNGVTSTVGGFATSGTNQKFLQSTLAGSQATLSQATGTVSVSYLTIQDSNATGGATWNAYVDQGNIDAGNADGWDFGISPVVGGNEYTYQLRSFTQPRRF